MIIQEEQVNNINKPRERFHIGNNRVLMVKRALLFIFFMLTGATFWGQECTVFLKETGTNLTVQYANVCWKSIRNTDSKGNTISSMDGSIIVPLNAGEHVILSISSVGYKSFYDTLAISENSIIELEQDIFSLEQVTVTGTRTPHTLKEAPVLTQIISRQEIERVDATTLSDILETEVPGIEMSRHGYGQSMSVQGLEPQYTLILVDGERMAGETGGNVDYSRINAANIERVEIVRGASSALYGSNAMGGVINIITKKPRKKVDISASVRYAQYNEKNYDSEKYYDEEYERNFYKNQDKPNLNGNLSIGFRNKNFYSNSFLNFKRTDGYVLEDREALKYYYVQADTGVVEPLGTLSISGMQDFTITQKLGYDDGKKWAFELRGNYYQHEEFPTQVNNWLHDLYKNYTVGGFAKFRINEKNQIQLSYNTDVYDKYDVYERKADSTALNYRNTFHNVKLNQTFLLGAKHNILVAAETLYEILETDMFVSDASSLLAKSANDAVLVFQDEYKITDKFQTVLGLRAGYHSTFTFHASPSVTFRYDLKPFNLRFNYARGYRSPTLKELYMNWSHLGMFQIVGSTDLKPETNDYFALSADYFNIAKKVNATFIASYNQIHNKIDGVWLTDSTVNYVNLDKVKVFNFESILKWRIHKCVNLKGGYVFTKQIRDNDVVALSEVSPHALISQIEWLYSTEKFDFSANLSGKIYGKKTVTGENEDDSSPLFKEKYEIHYPAYSLWNLTINVKYKEQLTFSTGFKNLFNYTSPTVTMNTTPSIGRRYFLSLQYNF